jgi:hypothetical protein
MAPSSQDTAILHVGSEQGPDMDDPDGYPRDHIATCYGEPAMDPSDPDVADRPPDLITDLADNRTARTDNAVRSRDLAGIVDLFIVTA